MVYFFAEKLGIVVNKLYFCGMKMYPMLFEEDLHTLVWGWERWEVSAVPSSVSVVANGEWKGKELVAVINEMPEEVLGKAVNER